MLIISKFLGRVTIQRISKGFAEWMGRNVVFAVRSDSAMWSQKRTSGPNIGHNSVWETSRLLLECFAGYGLISPSRSFNVPSDRRKERMDASGSGILRPPGTPMPDPFNPGYHPRAMTDSERRMSACLADSKVDSMDFRHLSAFQKVYQERSYSIAEPGDYFSRKSVVRMMQNLRAGS